MAELTSWLGREAGRQLGAYLRGKFDLVFSRVAALDATLGNKANKFSVDAALGGKVDKASGQRLMTSAEASKLAGIAPGAQVNPTLAQATGTSTAAVMSQAAVTRELQNGVVAAALARAFFLRGKAEAGAKTYVPFNTASASEKIQAAEGQVVVVTRNAVNPVLVDLALPLHPYYAGEVFLNPNAGVFSNAHIPVRFIPAGYGGPAFSGWLHSEFVSQSGSYAYVAWMGDGAALIENYSGANAALVVGVYPYSALPLVSVTVNLPHIGNKTFTTPGIYRFDVNGNPAVTPWQIPAVKLADPLGYSDANFYAGNVFVQNTASFTEPALLAGVYLAEKTRLFKIADYTY